jgi:hypothetical protein
VSDAVQVGNVIPSDSPSVLEVTLSDRPEHPFKLATLEEVGGGLSRRRCLAVLM